MSQFIIDSFSFPTQGGGSSIELYDIYLDTTLQQIYVSYSGNDGQLSNVTPEQRGRDDGDVIGSFITDDGVNNINVVARLASPFAEITSVTQVVPNPTTCDLNFSTSATPETQQGANDGSITVTATSSYSGIEVSLDNTTWQSVTSGSPYVFNNLTPGSYTVYSRDSNGCNYSKSITVDAYNNPLAGGLPQVEVTPGNISRWNAAYNPIVLNFNSITTGKTNLRIEVEITSQQGVVNGSWSADSSGKTRADISGYLKTLVNSNDAFDYSVLNWRDLDRAASFTLRYREVYDEGTSSWYSSVHPLYVVYSAKQLGDKYGGNMAEYVTFGGGLVIPPTPINYSVVQLGSPYVDANLAINIGGTVVKQVFSDETGVENANVGQSFSFSAFVIDNPDDPNGKLTMIIRKNGQVVFQQRIPATAGSNMVYNGTSDYGATYSIEVYSSVTTQSLPYINIPDSTTPAPSTPTLAKFMTKFLEPTLTLGKPFDLSFILSEYIITTDIKMRTTSLDINRQIIGGSTQNGYLLNNDSGYILASDFGRLIISQGVLPPVQNDGIFEQLGVNRLMLPGNPALNVEYYQVQLYVGPDNAPSFITYPLIVKVDRLCLNKPSVYLKWMNSVGGWDYWNFTFDNVRSLTTANDKVIDRYVFDWENDQTIADVIEKSAVEKIVFGVNGLTDAQAVGLVGLGTSIKVQMLVNDNPYKWHTVIVTPGSFETKKAKGVLTDFKFTISLPELNIQRQ